MSNSNYKGLRIGNFVIRPLGIAAIVLLVLIIAGVVVLIVNPFAPAGDNAIAPVSQGNLITEGEPGSDDPAETAETPVPTVEPTATPAPEPRSATIRSLGEIAIQEKLLAAALQEDGSYNFAPMFENVAHLMGDADYTVADVEGTLGGTFGKYSGTSSAMVTPASLLDALKANGVDMLTVANDHALDGNLAELVAGMQNIKAAGMEYVGGATSAEEKAQPKIVEINDIKVGFLAYTESVNGKQKKASAGSTEYGVNLISKKTKPAQDVKALRDAGAEVIVTYMSWGEMLKRSATENQKIFAKALVQAGVDVIIGYNPHVIQPVMWLEAGGNKTLCLFSAGNFLSGSRKQYSDSGVIFQFTIQEKANLSGFEIVNPTYIPTYVWRSETDGKYDYRTMAVGEWVDVQPEGMDYTQYTRLKTVWAESQSILGTDVATIASN